MTRRWVPGKKPTIADIKNVITNSVSKFLNNDDVDAIARGIMNLIDDRASGRS